MMLDSFSDCIKSYLTNLGLITSDETERNSLDRLNLLFLLIFSGSSSAHRPQSCCQDSQQTKD